MLSRRGLKTDHCHRNTDYCVVSRNYLERKTEDTVPSSKNQRQKENSFVLTPLYFYYLTRYLQIL